MHVLDLNFFFKMWIFSFSSVTKSKHFHFFLKIEAAYTHCQASKICPYIDFKQSDYLFTFTIALRTGVFSHIGIFNFKHVWNIIKFTCLNNNIMKHIWTIIMCLHLYNVRACITFKALLINPVYNAQKTPGNCRCFAL